MEDWADSILSTLEVNLDKFLGAVKRGRERLHERSQETVVAGVGAPGSDNEETLLMEASKATLARMTSFSLRSLRLRPGEEHRDEQEVALEPLQLGGQRYLPVPDKVQAELAISKATSGTVFELRFQTRLHGPCYRCLADAVVDVDIAGREYQATSPDTDELRTPYLENEQLDLSAWARDALVLELPDKILVGPTARACARSAAGTVTSSPTCTSDQEPTCAGPPSRSSRTSSARRVWRDLAVPRAALLVPRAGPQSHPGY